MAYLIIKVDGKDSKALKQIPMTKTEIGRLKNGLSCYTIISVATHRVSHVGACKRPTPENLWDGSRRRRYGFRDAVPSGPTASAPPAQKPAQVAGFFDKLFGKKKPKRNPMSKRVYYVPGRGEGSPMSRRGELVTMGRARRRRRRRR